MSAPRPPGVWPEAVSPRSGLAVERSRFYFDAARVGIDLSGWDADWESARVLIRQLSCDMPVPPRGEHPPMADRRGADRGPTIPMSDPFTVTKPN